MIKVLTSLEYTSAQKFIDEFISRNQLNDIPLVLSVISELYGRKLSYDMSNLTQRHISFAQSLVLMFKNVKSKFSVDEFITHAKDLYDQYVDSVDIFLTSDTKYSSETKEHIANMCKNTCGVKKFIMHENISTDHGGGFVARFRDYILDASYARQIK